MALMNENEYEKWYDDYLRDIESPYSINDFDSPFVHAPTPVNKTRWFLCLGITLVGTIIISGICFSTYGKSGGWSWSWLGNATLSLAIGVIASLIIMAYSSQRDKNISFYSTILPDMQRKYWNMRKAFDGCIVRMVENTKQKDYLAYYQAWEMSTIACHVILGYLEHLVKALPFTPDSLSKINVNTIKEVHDEIKAIRSQIDKEFSVTGDMTAEMRAECQKTLSYGNKALNIIFDLLLEFNCNLYSLHSSHVSRSLR